MLAVTRLLILLSLLAEGEGGTVLRLPISMVVRVVEALTQAARLRVEPARVVKVSMEVQAQALAVVAVVALVRLAPATLLTVAMVLFRALRALRHSVVAVAVAPVAVLPVLTARERVVLVVEAMGQRVQETTRQPGK